jgi:hypothetical protein
MNASDAAQLLINLLAVLLVLTPLLMLSYLAGRRSRMTGRVDELERLRPDILLNGTIWQATFDADEPSSSPPLSVKVAWRQTGSRIVAETQLVNGVHLSLEGVLHHRHVCCLALDQSRREDGLGAILVEIRPGDDQMIGMRARWSPESQTLILRKVCWQRFKMAARGG